MSKETTQKQRNALEKLFQNYDKPVIIPPPSEELKPPKPPEFVRNIMGSSAGAGSAEFHLYRKLRKRDMIREGIWKHQLEQEEKEKEFNEKIEKFKQHTEAKRNRKRAKRLKYKAKLKAKKLDKSPHDNKNSTDILASGHSDSDSSIKEDDALVENNQKRQLGTTSN